MKRVYKISLWSAAVIIALGVCIVAVVLLKDLLKPEFKETKIFPDETRTAPADTILNINGIEVKMIGVKGGKIECEGLKEVIELPDFYIAETEVTQGLWSAIMPSNPSVNRGDSWLPVENIDLTECLEFVNRLDSVSGYDFGIPSYPQWLYAAHSGDLGLSASQSVDCYAWHGSNSDNVSHHVSQKSPNGIGVYDMLGNVAEWTISGSDPLFIVAGGSYEDGEERMHNGHHEFDHGKVKVETIGLRLVIPHAELKRKMGRP